MRSSTILTAAALLLFSMSACTAASQAVVTVTATPSAGVTSAPNPTPTFDVAAEGWKNAKEFTENVNEGKYDAALEHVSEGSAAARYLTHMTAIDDASVAAGSGRVTSESELTFSEDEKSITQSDEGVEPTVWESFTWDDAGKLTGWSTGEDDTPLKDRLWTKEAQASTANADVTLVSAYKNDAGLWVVLDVKSKKTAIAPDCSPLLDDTKNRQREATNCMAPGKINKGKAGYVAFLFEGANFGGTLRYELTSAGYHALGTVKVKIR